MVIFFFLFLLFCSFHYILCSISIEVDGEEAKMLEGYTLIGKLPFEQLIAGPQKPADEEQCEVSLNYKRKHSL